MERNKIKFNVENDGIVYLCRAISKDSGEEFGYVVDIEAMDQLFRVYMQFDASNNFFNIKVFCGCIPPEIIELEYSISNFLCKC